MKYVLPIALLLMSWLVFDCLELGDDFSLFLAAIFNFLGLIVATRILKTESTILSYTVVIVCCISTGLMLLLFCYVYMLGSSWNH